MAEDSEIEWTTHTFNPWRGCSKVSPGCANCYAETMSGRNPKTLGVWGPNGTRVVASEAQWKLPLKWDREAKLAAELWEAIGGDTSRPGTMEHKGASCWWHRPRVFCASLADVFEDWRGDMVDSGGRVLQKADSSSDDPLYTKAKKLTMSDVRARLFQLIDATPNLDWLLLTKRPENYARLVPPMGNSRVDRPLREQFLRPNLWLGTSVENQQTADERIPHLLKIPAAVRFLSVEPLLGPVRLDFLRLEVGNPAQCVCEHGHGFTRCPNTGGIAQSCHKDECGCPGFRRRPGSWSGIDWVIVGGESGPGARPCRVEWIRDLVQQCKAASVPVFVKQLGSNPHEMVNVNGVTGSWPLNAANRHERIDGGNFRVSLRDRKGGDMAEWPADLRVREMPAKR